MNAIVSAFLLSDLSDIVLGYAFPYVGQHVFINHDYSVYCPSSYNQNLSQGYVLGQHSKLIAYLPGVYVIKVCALELCFHVSELSACTCHK